MRKKNRIGLMKRLRSWIGRIGTLNIILIVVGAFFVWFNWQMLVIFQNQGAIPETYACAVIAATIGECGICGWIRTTKDRQRERKWEKEDSASGENSEESKEVNDERDTI